MAGKEIVNSPIFQGVNKTKTAINFAKAGFKIIPQDKSKKTILTWDAATTDPEEIKKWHKQYPKCNFALITDGKIFVIDIDVKNNKNGIEVLKKIPGYNEGNTLTVRSGSGDGLHKYYFSTNGLIKNKNFDNGLEIKGAPRACITLPGSIYNDGREYKFIKDVPISEAPDWLLAYIKNGEKQKPKNYNATNTFITEGGRNTFLTSEAGKLRAAGLSKNAIFEALKIINDEKCRPLLVESEIKSIAEWIGKKETGVDDQLLDEFNLRYFKIKNPSCVFDKTTNTPLAHNHLKIFYRNNINYHLPSKRGKPLNIYEKWILESGNNADGIDYRPDLYPYDVFHKETEGITNTVLNIFSGFMKPDSGGDCSLFLDFIKKIIANNKENIYIWLLHWMARIVQKPTDRNHTYALALRSGQGCGKTFFFENFGKLFGKNYIKIEDMETILGFNSQIQNKVLVYLEECVFSANQKESNRLKDLITGKTLTINMKHIAEYTINNFITIGSGTNNDVSAPVELGDRRWVCLKISESRREDKKYFAAIENQLVNNKGYGKLMHYLKNFPLDFSILDNYPKTELHYENQRAWMFKNKPVFHFLDKLINESSELLNALNENPGWISAGEFNTAYNDFLSKERKKSVDARCIVPQLREILKIQDVYGKHYFRGKQRRAYFLHSFQHIENMLNPPESSEEIPF